MATNFKFIDLFAGIGGIRIPFEELGGQCVFSSEIDLDCQIAYEANFGERPHGDITKIDADDIPDHDVLLAGFLCQSFSIIGGQKGFADTRGTLFFDIERILKKKRPKAFLLENVKRLYTHDEGRTYAVIKERLEGLGYSIKTQILNSLDFGLPQKRERTYIVGFLNHAHTDSFSFPNEKKPFDLSSILEPEHLIDKSYYASAYIQEKRRSAVKGNPNRPSVWHENISKNISALPYSCALRASGSYNYLLLNGERRFTERELLRLQGFPDTFKIVLGYTKTRHQAGNSVSVPVIRAIAKNIKKAMETAAIEKKQRIKSQKENSSSRKKVAIAA